MPKTSSPTLGLSSPEIFQLRQKYGWNEIAVHKSESLVKKILRQFTDLLVIVLIAGGVLAFLLGERIDAIVILSIVIINALIGFIQEFRTEKMLDALKKLVAPLARVIRNGKETTIPSRELVPGDMIILSEGSRIPADAELIEINELKVDEAILTGESVPVTKTTDKKQKAELRTVFSGTTVATGSARAIVKAIGSDTEFGQVAELTTKTEKSESPLTKEMKTIGAFVGKIALVISLVLFLVGYFWQGHSLIVSLLFAVAVAVAAVPEGLPVTITTALALGMRKLALRGGLVRELKSVETLGATTVICSDKTGTLTYGEMTTVSGWMTETGEFSVSGSGYDPHGSVDISKNNKTAELLFMAGNFCNESALVKSAQKWKIIGDPTEGALKVAARKFGLALKTSQPTKIFPFDSDRKRMSVVVDTPSQSGAGQANIYAKGAPEQLLNRCTHFLDNQKLKKLTPAIRKKIIQQTEVFAKNALRVLGCAYREIKKGEVKKLTVDTAENRLVFLGLFGMRDSPRKEVKESVRLCQKAGIRITVVTGDFGITAAAIARELGITDEDTPVITGEEFRKLSDAKLKKLLNQKKNLIFARVKPTDKLRIVEAYKKLNEVVAVTGDGVNDAPALKRADIGIAMGRTGSDVAKEAASLVLTNDSFASVVTAVAEGRRIYSNMRKFILYTFSCNIGELIVVFATIIFGLPLPLTAILILIINLGTDLLPGLALGVDPPDAEAMNLPPRNPSKRIVEKSFILRFVSVGFIIGILVLIGYLGILWSNGWQWGEILVINAPLHRHAMSFVFATLLVIQLFNAFNFRSDTHSAFSRKIKTNKWLWGAIVASFLLALVVVEMPFAQAIFGTTNLSIMEWGMVTVLAGGVLVFEEIRKIFQLNNN